MKIIISGILIILFSSCHNSKKNDEVDNLNNSTETEEYYEVEQSPFQDGTYNATVEYYNTETNYSNTYDLEVEVEDNYVTVIYFPNDGYLDEDHIYPAELDEEGYTAIEGEDGKTYEIYIEQ